MLTVVCGEDVIASREYFNTLKKAYQNQGHEIYSLSNQDLINHDFFGSQPLGLFSQKIVYFSENLLKKLKDKKLSKIDIIDWEEKSSYELKADLKNNKHIIIKEFKPKKTIFSLLDSCYPGNLYSFLNIFNSISAKEDIELIFYLLVRQIRNLLLIKMEEKLEKLQPWQIKKLKMQAKMWPIDKLISFYDSLYRLELSIKTSNNPYNLKKSLEILAAFFL